MLAKTIAFVAGSLLYWAVAFYLFLMFALGDCAAHDQTPPGRCWGDDVNFPEWAIFSVGGFVLLTVGYWWLARRKSRAR